MPHWEDVLEFTVGSIEEPRTKTRKTAKWGPAAIRTPRGGRQRRSFEACVYVGPERTLYLDAGLTRLLCSVVATGEYSWDVVDAHGASVGALARLGSGRPLARPNWRIDQPGRPEVIGRTEWLSGSASEVAGKALGAVLGGVLQSIGDLGAEGGDQPTKPRVLEWRAGDRVVMRSRGVESITVSSSWLDRRLAFAYALVIR
ncbi:hypothetical protein [Kribbella sp. NPDC048928]|uniref:hypothetical protein n=1 Tax=Kribbella sp. NPDC048928 TaxID=3364111 RepID=UPI003717DF9B